MKRLVLIIILFSSSLLAQDRGFRSEGREFYLGYLHPRVGSFYENYFKVYAIVSSYEENEITVSYFSGGGVEQDFRKYLITGGGIAQIQLDRLRMQTDTIGDKAEYKSCHITAKRPVSIQYYSTGPNSCGSYLALPIHSWGKKHVVASYNDNPAVGAWLVKELSSGVFNIVAAYDGTVVQITPSARTNGGFAGVNQGAGSTGKPQPYSVSLSRGQTYSVRSASSAISADDDISGSIITASHPVAVLAGHEDAFVGNSGSIVNSGGGQELRDFMVDQMIPVEFWDNTGVIGIPHVDTRGTVTEGLGENYRIYVADTYTPQSVTANGINYTPGPYAPVELFNVEVPMTFSSSGSTRFTAVQYELRSHGSLSPYPAPSITSLVSESQWRTSYSSVTSINQWTQNFTNYLTVIGPADQFESIMVGGGGETFKPINTALPATIKTWHKGSIPGFPHLKAVTYDVNYAFWLGKNHIVTATFPFMVYPHGNPTTYANSNYDYYHSYANAGGMSLFDKDVSRRLKVDIDTLCTGGWKVCVTDTNENGGIRYISLLDDPHGYLYAGTSYQHANVSILPLHDPLGLGEFSLTGDEPSYCFTVGVNDPGKEAYAPLIMYDKAGNYRIIELRQSPRKLTITPDPFTNLDLFSGSKLGVKFCTTFAVYNDKASPTSYSVEALSLSTSQFTLADIQPALPALLMPGDTLTFDVCFLSTDTLLHRDTIRVIANCLDLRLPLAASTVRPILIASDVTFGDLLVGKTACKPVTLKNTGQATFTAQNGSIIQSDPIFAFDSASSARFPLTLAPGATVTLNVCYTPDTIRSHTAFINWQTDIVPPFASEQKSITNLSGQGYAESGMVGLTSTQRISIRPNPAVNKIMVEFDHTGGQEASIEIFDVLGRRVFVRPFDELLSGSNRLVLDLPPLRTGTYTVIFRSGEVTATEQLIIE